MTTKKALITGIIVHDVSVTPRGTIIYCIGNDIKREIQLDSSLHWGENILIHENALELEEDKETPYWYNRLSMFVTSRSGMSGNFVRII